MITNALRCSATTPCNDTVQIMYGQTILELSGITKLSLQVWKRTRPLFGTFTEAYCTFTSGFRRFQLEGEKDAGDYTVITKDCPGLVLVDDSGSELWLSGCASGYTGEGAAGAGYILLSEQFNPAHIDLVPFAKRLYIRKGQAEPLQFERRNEKRTILAGTWSRHITNLIASGYFQHVDDD